MGTQGPEVVQLKAQDEKDKSEEKTEFWRGRGESGQPKVDNNLCQGGDRGGKSPGEEEQMTREKDSRKEGKATEENKGVEDEEEQGKGERKGGEITGRGKETEEDMKGRVGDRPSENCKSSCSPQRKTVAAGCHPSLLLRLLSPTLPYIHLKALSRRPPISIAPQSRRESVYSVNLKTHFLKMKISLDLLHLL